MFKSYNARVVLIVLIFSMNLAGCQPKPEMPTGADVTWNLVVLGDSSFWELGKAYAEQIHQDVGVQVEVYDYAIGSFSAGQVLDILNGGQTSSQQLRNLPGDLANADVVIMFLNPNLSETPDYPMDFGGCFSETASQVGSCDPRSFTVWIEHLKSIWGEILRLREGKPTILRATDLYNPLVAPWQETGIFDECTKCWMTISEAARQAAEAYNIPFLSRLDVINGPNHDLDPRTMGYITEDGEHPTPLLAQFTAQKLAELGYTPVTPP
jgi:hypothetical protein